MTVATSGLLYSLVSNGLITKDQAKKISEEAERDEIPAISYIVNNKILTSSQIVQVFEKELGYPYLNMDDFEVNEISKDFLDEKLITRCHALPIYVEGKTLYLAMSDPTNIKALDDFGMRFGYHTDVILVDEDKLSKGINKLFGDSMASLDVGLSDIELSTIAEEDTQDSAATPTDESDDTPIVKFVNKLLLDAIRKGASDLHFEPYEKKYRVRFRIDGILHEVAKPPIESKDKIAARIKVMSKLDIAERRIPQDGRIKIKVSPTKSMDMRVNTLPTLWGEKIVMRILDSSAAKLNIDMLGYEPVQKANYLEALNKPQGLILVTGPTGSGKTVSLYTGLSILNTVETNISTAEDPVEINLEGINQVQINYKAGLTFASALKAFLRQDPDVIMVGEIRDLETAEIAVKAAQTGHLVLSTLHTNSAPETVTRLLNMGVPGFNIASSVTLIMAQRLARRLCEKCKILDNIPEHELLKIGYTQEQIQNGLKIYKANPKGCDNCSGGYKGRVGIYEILKMSDTLAMLIMEGGNSLELAKKAEEEGMVPLRKSGLEKVAQGVTSLQEVFRVTSG
ncbi:MAG: type IV-A pilus assembly ATPase PilB [Succinivibrionaceae bacterium]